MTPPNRYIVKLTNGDVVEYAPRSRSDVAPFKLPSGQRVHAKGILHSGHREQDRRAIRDVSHSYWVSQGLKSRAKVVRP